LGSPVPKVALRGQVPCCDEHPAVFVGL